MRKRRRYSIERRERVWLVVETTHNGMHYVHEVRGAYPKRYMARKHVYVLERMAEARERVDA